MADSPATPTLPTFSWIGHLLEDDRELLSSYGQFFPGHPGNVIIEEGVLQTEVFVVISGELEVHSLDEAGSRILRARIGPGETLGEISLFDPGPALATVTASEFSQLWRIADEDLIQFMEDNPGAGNVLLRTLATILAQRLRQVDPAAFGMSTYAVVESPELEEQDATVENPTRSEVTETETTLPVIPLPPNTTPAIPAAAGVPASTPVTLASSQRGAVRNPNPAATGLTPVQPAPAGTGTTGKQPAAALLHKAPPGGKMRTGTQVLPDPDELEPL